MLKRFALAFAIMIVGMIGAAAIAAPAQAYRPSYCPDIDGYLCWSDNAANHAAAHIYIINTHSLNTRYCINIGVASDGMDWNNAIRSMYFQDQNSHHWVAHYSGANCSGVVVVQVGGLLEDNKEHSCNQSVNIWNGSCNPPTISSLQYYII